MLQLAGAACTAVRSQLNAPARPGRVVGRGRDAVYIESATGVLALLTERAVRVPCALVLGPARPLPGSLRPGSEIRVGAGGLRWRDGRPRLVTTARDVSVVAASWWAPDQVLPRGSGAYDDRPLAILSGAVHGHRLPAGVAGALAGAAQALAAGEPESAAGRLVTVLGSGAGLTPSADDAAAGLLLAARALADTPEELAAVQRLARHVGEGASVRTNAVSAALLLHAGEGRAAHPLVAAVTALTQPWPDLQLRAALDALLRLGHTSGADTACGILAALRALRQPAPGDCAAGRLAVRSTG